MTVLAATIPWLAACAGPQSMLEPAGPAARSIATVWWAMLAFFTLVLVVVVALWLYAQHRAPRPYSAEAAQRIGLKWIVGGGVLLPGITIFVLLLFGLPAGKSMLPLPQPGAAPLRIEVVGHQWWWEVRYPDAGVVTANQLVLPAGRAIDIHVRSADVIHAFWIPRLAGKIDMIPGMELVTRIQADAPGEFRAQCAEFCGAQHARMVLSVAALADEDFTAWLAARRDAPAADPSHGAAIAAFRPYCGHCHRVAGVSDGRSAPDLSDLGARPTLGAGTLVHTPGALRKWLHEHQRLKPDNKMPSHDQIPAATLDAIAAWLETLAP